MHTVLLLATQTKKILSFCHRSTLPVASASIGQESLRLGLQSLLPTTAGGAGSMVGNLCIHWSASSSAVTSQLLNSRRFLPRLLGSNNGAREFLNS